jgi:D-glycero-D-manno-heptose 1,7-bisphosphate phosphatase
MPDRSSDTPRSALPMRPAAFFDRDGVLNVDIGYAHKPEQLKWIEGAQQAIRLLNDTHFYVIVVTNQSGVARGYFDEAAVQRFHAKMQEGLAARGAHIDAFYYCRHHPEGTIKRFAIQCRCRKPSTGLLEQAAREWPIDLNASFLIGDKEADFASPFNVARQTKPRHIWPGFQRARSVFARIYNLHRAGRCGRGFCTRPGTGPHRYRLY